MAALTAALLGASALASYASQKKQGEATASALDVNASLADQQANDAIARGKDAAGQSAQNTRGFLGTQRAALGASGVEVDSGSAATLQSDTAQLGELDRMMIEHNAARDAYGIRTQAAIDRNQGDQVRTASRNNARGTLLTAGVQLGGMYDASRQRAKMVA
jgi:hypothetical protein